jgi:hypothetical protein
MINNNVVVMLSTLNTDSVRVLNTVYTQTLETAEFDDLDSLEALYNSGWINGVDLDGDCLWIMTGAGRVLYAILEDVIV